MSLMSRYLRQKSVFTALLILNYFRLFQRLTMNAALSITMLILSIKDAKSKIYLVKTNSTKQNDLGQVITFNNWSNDEKKVGADYAAEPNIEYGEGSNVKLSCPSPIDFKDCQFKAPTGKIHKLGISGKPYKSGRVESLQKVKLENIEHVK